MARPTAGRIFPAAQPQTEFTTIMTVPFAVAFFSTSAAVRASAIPKRVSSSRMGAIIGSGYMQSPYDVLVDYIGKPSRQGWVDQKWERNAGAKTSSARRVGEIAVSVRDWRPRTRSHNDGR